MTALCSSIAVATTEVIDSTLRMASPIRLIEATEACVESWISEICWAISLVAFEVCSASDLTSEATTAKPRPAAPARAASMVAFSAKRLVWLAISLIRWVTVSTLAAACDNLPIMVCARVAAVTASSVMARCAFTWLDMPAIVLASCAEALATLCALASASSAAAATLLVFCSSVSALSLISAAFAAIRLVPEATSPTAV